MLEVRPCWCGATSREAFGSHYDKCRSCGGLLYSRPFALEDYTSGSSPSSFYGIRYWDEHVPQVLKLPGLEERARSDLGDRSVFYLNRILKYVAPGSQVLEVGCAPGSLSFLMNQSGFRVTGVEIGDEVVGFVRSRFGVDVHPGPLEQAGLVETFDAIVMIDVLEHLPLPVSTLRACAERLRTGGALLIQTPCYRGEGTDWPMLVPAEHLFLYTEDSVEQLLGQAGFHVVEICESLYPYDMWIVASRDGGLSERRDPLRDVEPLGRAMIELVHLAAAARLDLDSVVAECTEKDRLIERLSEDLARSHDNDTRKEETISRLLQDAEDLRADRHRKEDLIVSATAELETVRADQHAKEALIAELTLELEGVRADQAAKEELIGRISVDLAAVRADQSDKEELINKLAARLSEMETKANTGEPAQTVDDIPSE